MSFAIYLYHPQVKDKALEGLEIDEFKHPNLSESSVRSFVEKLLTYGYQLESQSAASQEFVKHVGTCPVQVAVFKTEIAFSVPYWKGSDEAIFEALQDSSELCDEDHMVTFNPQDGEWGP